MRSQQIVYVVHYVDGDRSYHANRKDAESCARANRGWAKNDDPDYNPFVEQAIVPVTKYALIEWLNENASVPSRQGGTS